jgi:hypothetical protein
MAYDPNHLDAAARFLGPEPSGKAFNIIGDKEYELKLAIAGNSIFGSNLRPLILTPETYVENASSNFLDLMNSFKSAAGSGIRLDPHGFIPNKYVLVSLGVDTVSGTLPTAEFFLNGWQCRVRFPISFKNGQVDLGLLRTQQDANLKTLLSDHVAGDEHRIELETTVRNGSEFYRGFKHAVNGLPEFAQHIDDADLRVREICMTSRTGFYMVMKVPNHNVSILLHGSYDVSRYTTSTTDMFVNPLPRVEVEFEAKMMWGTAPNMDTEQGQKAYIDMIFEELTAHGHDLGMNPFTISKLEDASLAVERYYRDHKADIGNFIAHVRGSGVSQDIPNHLLFALATGQKPKDVLSGIIREGNNHRLVALAMGMPDPATMLNIPSRHLAVA